MFIDDLFPRSLSSSSSSNNIQDQCLIITDIYDVREKRGVAGNTIPNPNIRGQKQKKCTKVLLYMELLAGKMLFWALSLSLDTHTTTPTMFKPMTVIFFFSMCAYTCVYISLSLK